MTRLLRSCIELRWDIAASVTYSAQAFPSASCGDGKCNDKLLHAVPALPGRSDRTASIVNKNKVVNEIRVFMLMLLVVSSLRSALADWNDVPTGSMKPTIEEGDRVVVNKLAYDLKIPFTTIEVAKGGDPQRGDIVVLFSPVDGW